jgi:hypothetical protein
MPAGQLRVNWDRLLLSAKGPAYMTWFPHVAGEAMWQTDQRTKDP